MQIQPTKPRSKYSHNVFGPLGVSEQTRFSITGLLFREILTVNSISLNFFIHRISVGAIPVRTRKHNFHTALIRYRFAAHMYEITVTNGFKFSCDLFVIIKIPAVLAGN